jgi:uncharacterized damage-inducible protein DinB
MDKKTIERLFAYNSWANHRAVESCAQVSQQDFLRQIGGSFGSLRNTLAHIMDVEWLYHERWNGRAPTQLPKSEDYPDLGAIRARWQGIERDVDRYVQRLAVADLAREIEFRNTQGVLYRHSLSDVMQHLVNHSTYHRGQVTTLLRMAGGKPQATDLIVFYRERSGQPVVN